MKTGLNCLLMTPCIFVYFVAVIEQAVFARFSSLTCVIRYHNQCLQIKAKFTPLGSKDVKVFEVGR